MISPIDVVRSLAPRNVLRFASPAKLLLLFFLLVLYLAFPFRTPNAPTFLSTPAAHDRLAQATLPDLVDIYEQVRLEVLQHKDYNGSATAEKLRAPLTLPDGSPNLDAALDNYVGRLRRFADDYFKNTPDHITAGVRGSLNDILQRIPPRSRPSRFPAKVWSTHPAGARGVQEGFDVWRKLLPLPLAPKLLREMRYSPEVDWMKVAKDGQPWEVIVTDDDGLDKWMSQWTGEKLGRGVKGQGRWSKLWASLDRGVLRADLFRYMSMLAAGGIWSDSDTMPISHPYLWGLRAPSILHPDLEGLITLIDRALPMTVPNMKNRLNPREVFDNYTPHNYTLDKRIGASSYTPPYSPHIRRAPLSVSTEERLPSILDPGISIIVAIEWDSMIGRTLSMWKSWTWFRLQRSWPDCCFPRGLQMVQNLLVSKPFHPIMLDTLSTIAGLVDRGADKGLGPLELTGPGPFTDAVFRYLLVQYGVTPDDLRALPGPVRIGDVLILQEEALHAPEKAMVRLLKHIQKIGGNLLGGASARDPWLYRSGYESWQTGGKKVAYHGLTGIWKNQ
ncbi:hypothetical protein IAU60_004600 [Kwoniella sp. DSM 27419]